MANESLNPDDWSEDDWIKRVAAVGDRHPDLDPMVVVEAVNGGHVTLTPEGETVILSVSAEMFAEMQQIISDVEGGS